MEAIITLNLQIRKKGSWNQCLPRRPLHVTRLHTWQSKAILLTTSSFRFLLGTFSWFSGCLEKRNKEDVWKGKLKVNFSAFLSKLHCSWARTAFDYPCPCPFQNADLHVTTLWALSAVTWVGATQGSCCVNKTGMMYQVLVPCIHENDCDILVTSRICKKGTPGALRNADFYHGRTKTYRMKLWTGEPPHHTHPEHIHFKRLGKMLSFKITTRHN